MILLSYDERVTSEDVMIMGSQRMGVKHVPLSLSLMILFAAYAGPVSAAPGPAITSKKVSGVASVGEWQSANQSEKVIKGGEGDFEGSEDVNVFSINQNLDKGVEAIKLLNIDMLSFVEK